MQTSLINNEITFAEVMTSQYQHKWNCNATTVNTQRDHNQSSIFGKHIQTRNTGKIKAE